MRRFYEDVWEAMPDRLEPYELERRRAFLLGRLRPGIRVLDLGCGSGELAAAAAEAGAEVTGMDVAEAALARARKRHPGLSFELAPPHGPLPAPDGKFELVWASEVIEHVADTAAWLSEVRRVLAPGGRLALTTPYHGRLQAAAIALARFERHFDPVGQHLRFYSARSLRVLLDNFGFDEIDIQTAGGLPLVRRMLLATARRATLAA